MAKVFRFFVNLWLTLASIAYPIGWLCFHESEWLNGLIGVMAVMWLLKGIQAVRFQRFFAIGMAVLLTVIAVTRSLETMYWYPVIISGVLLTLFGSSLFSEQSLIERLARLQDPNLPPQAIGYTRRVTQIWCGFFLFNIATCTALILTQQYQWWAWYSGGISYLIMGILFGGEWLVRQKIKQ
ncbi:hypothetical protein A1D29_01445 [Pasteurellaceae bacterium Orientalotternb1]|nr:hypothetical protein A1D29_01445 [Pasteurellaceae bacterium Orientalotternb1]